jgi:hypothetical protein
MLNYSQTPARELERIVEDITKYSIMNLTHEQATAMYDVSVRLLELRQYMRTVEFTKETV